MALAKCVKLISLVGRAFYDDESVAILDFLARNNYLRDDGEHELLGEKLQLGARQIRRCLVTLVAHKLVCRETLRERILQDGTSGGEAKYGERRSRQGLVC